MRLRDRFTEIQSDIDGLRQEIIGALGSRKSGSFDDLFEHLRNDYITTSVDLKSINSELIAEILLTKVIRTTRKKRKWIGLGKSYLQKISNNHYSQSQADIKR